jgi:2-hydroxy-3-oxopropionate reductase
MGLPMAENLLAAGRALRVHRVKERSRSLVEAGATAAGSPAEAAAGAEVVILMLPDSPDVEGVLVGADGVLEALEPGALVIDMSSISPSVTRELARRTQQAGGRYVDAPVSGGEVGAREGTLTIFVGGEDEAIAEAMPLLEVLGGRITHMGPVGAGQATKVANQVIVGLTIQAVAEGLALAEASGIDPDAVREALDGGFATSRILELHGARMASRDFAPGFRMRLHRKDLGLALDIADELRVETPGTAAVAARMDALIDADGGELDHSALFRTLREETS